MKRNIAFQTIIFRRTKYLVERVERSENDGLDIRFILHSPSGRTFWVVPSKGRPDRLIALSRFTHFSPFRPSPFSGIWFAVANDGTLAFAAPDA